MKKRFECLAAVFLLTGLLPSGSAQAAAASVGTFTGGDPGEGLDLQGTFAYALNVGPSGAAGKVSDAVFTGDNVAGVTIVANNSIGTGGWGAANYGATDNDKNLSLAMNSIRWAAAPTVVTVTLKVETGVEYKLQLLFHEHSSVGRGFNVVINGTTEVPNFMSGANQNGGSTDQESFEATRSTVGSVISQQFVASGDTVTVVLDGAAADSGDITDHNAIISGLTLERISAVVDSDADGLRDDWEGRNFGDLSATAAGDADNDGLTNLQEQTLATNPKNGDTDGDGLGDGDEVNQYHTDPLKVGDTDGDMLSDGSEVTLYHTDPTKVDTDGDGFNDYYEIHLLTDPLDANSKPKKTLANLFYGPDEGQGLDFSGNFVYALSFGTEQPGGQIHDALFTSDSVEGVLVEASQVANSWNVGVNYGESEAQLVLSSIMSNLRWSDSGNATTPAVTITLSNLKVGAAYKLQMLYGEYLWSRGFNVSVNGRLVAKEFAPYQWQGGFVEANGATSRTNGVVLTHSFIANTTNALILLDGRPVTDPAMTDHNAIIEAASLEITAEAVDSDSDGLWDAWEMEVFGSLAQSGEGDADGDGLKNSLEFSLNADPMKADTDGDGLTDGEEVNTSHTDPTSADTDVDGLSDGDEFKTYHTDPVKADSDGDTLSDGDEVKTYKSDPLKMDTDSDGMDDGKEVYTGSDPTKAEPATQFSNVVVQAFNGGDAGEGLDLQGNFLYAFNVSSAGPAGLAGNADFTADNAAGITVTAPNNIPNWDTPEYGDTPADDVIEKVMQSIRYGPSVKVELTGLIPGSTYKVQMLFYEQCCNTRGFNIYGDGQLITADFSPPEIQGEVNNINSGAVVAADFVTQRSKVTLVLTTYGRTREDLTDPNAILDGVTLEILRLSDVTPQPKISGIAKAAEGVSITVDTSSGKTYTLEYKANLTDATWVAGDQKTATGTSTVLTDNTADHLTSHGFWRVRTQ